MPDTERPEWVTCVVVQGRKTECGRRVCFEFTFVSWEHAEANEAAGGMLVTCPECKAARRT